MIELSWIIFGSVVLFALFLDLFVFHRHPHKISVKESLILSAFWVGVGIAFSGYVYYTKGTQAFLDVYNGLFFGKSLKLGQHICVHSYIFLL
jgi:hypothetical protein